MAAGFFDWCEFLPQMDQDGTLDDAAIDAVRRVAEYLEALRQAYYEDEPSDTVDYPWSFAALAFGNDWATVRTLSRDALTQLARLGVPIPTLTESDFNVPRDDAP